MMTTALLELPEAVAKTQRGADVGVRVRGVVKDFGDGDARLRVLHEVDVDVLTSELTLLVGPSGCGKTTLISIIAGLLDPSQGSVAVLGTDLAQLSGRRLVEFRAKNIGF